MPVFALFFGSYRTRRLIGFFIVCFVAVSLVVTTGILLHLSQPTHDSVDATGSDIDVDEVERQVAERINEQRKENGLNTLQQHDEIQTVARAHSQDMHDRNFHGHTNPSGETPQDRLEHIDECEDYASENYAYMDIARDVYTSSPNVYDTRSTDGLTHAFVDWWTHSPPHLENQLDASWSHFGVGVVLKNGNAKATMNFC